MDIFKNHHVADALKKTALQLIIEGFGLEVEIWDSQYKGIDDCLAAGGQIRTIAGGTGYTEILKISKNAKKLWKMEQYNKRRAAKNQNDGSQ